MKSVAIFSQEDVSSPHRHKADEAYVVGVGESPVGAYLSIPHVIDVARDAGVKAIHPGYGFLSENAEFAQACADNGIKFVGPTIANLKTFGDKTSAREQAIKCGVPVIEGSDGPVKDAADAKAFTDRVGFPVIIKAAHGGGGRGMRVVTNPSEIEAQFDLATREAEAAFGDGTVFIEQYLDSPRHIEVQILGDGTGNVVHLYERDCSVQRRHQKVVEMAPSKGLSDEVKQAMYRDAVNITADANYLNAGTVEFLVDKEGRHFFIEVNPRVQVEHTVTEEVVGIDIVKSQFRIAAGATLKELGLFQDSISTNGFAMQCRITTEDATKDFAPDTGTLMVYRSPGGKGVRLDGGPGFSGANIQPYYDSLLTKITVKGIDLDNTIATMRRALAEFRIRGVTTNIPFLQNVMSHPDLRTGAVTTSFIGDNPHLLIPRNDQNRAQRMMQYLGDLRVNGHVDPGVAPINFKLPKPPQVPDLQERSGEQIGLRNLKHVLNESGPEGFAKAVRNHDGLLLTDTTWRDAHQSLLATRCRTVDMLNIAPATSVALDRAFSIECWGGATFDVAMRFLMECPWERLEQLREQVPNVPFQMLLRGANAVGYTSYPDNVVHAFCEQSVKSGMDVFRVFDSLNYVENLRLGIDAVGGAGGVVEAGLCYTGDVSDPNKTKYNLDYYLGVTRELVDLDIHVLGIKDMAGLLKPKAAELLVGALRQEFPDLPIHVHTHDTSGTGVASMLACAHAGADAVDVAIDSMSGLTSQPSMGAVVASLEGTDLDTGIDMREVAELNNYWEAVRGMYAPLESGQKSGSSDVFHHEMPGGQYTNLLFQSQQLGLTGQWPAVKAAYADANELMGDIVKVTPSSKVVGDLAQFMVANSLSKDEVVEQAETLSLPSSVVEYFQGYLGIPTGGFPEPLRTRVLANKPSLPNGKSCFEGRPGAEMDDYDFAVSQKDLTAKYGEGVDRREVLSHVMYPAVYQEWKDYRTAYGDVSKLPTNNFLQAMEVGEIVEVELEPGKTLYIEMVGISEPNGNNERRVDFKLNGEARFVVVQDDSGENETAGGNEKADAGNDAHVGAPMPGVVVSVNVEVGQRVEAGDALVTLSAMKMETVVTAVKGGVVGRVSAAAGDNLAAGDLLMVVEDDNE